MDYFHWGIDPVFIALGPLKIRWYGLFFAFGLYLAIQALTRVFRDRGFPDAHVGMLSWQLPVGMIVFAHLIHLMFYEHGAFTADWERVLALGHAFSEYGILGVWQTLTQLRLLQIGVGLASHGGGLGVALALFGFCRRHGVSFHKYADTVMVASVWLFPWVRVGNFFNSEIIGRATEVPWAIVFENLPNPEPRHPSQLYEAIAGFLLVGVGEWLHRRRDRLRPGNILYILLGLYFSYRFGLEFFKEYQSEAVSRDFPLTMGHLLSIGPIVLCALMLAVPPRTRLFPLREPAQEGEADAGDCGSDGESDDQKAERTSRKPKPRRRSKVKRRKNR